MKWSILQSQQKCLRFYPVRDLHTSILLLVNICNVYVLGCVFTEAETNGDEQKVGVSTEAKTSNQASQAVNLYTVRTERSLIWKHFNLKPMNKIPMKLVYLSKRFSE